MISRVADHCFWFGRYLERTESTARVLSVTTNLALDAELEGVNAEGPFRWSLRDWLAAPARPLLGSRRRPAPRSAAIAPPHTHKHPAQCLACARLGRACPH